jgi:hypothetical protein
MGLKCSPDYAQEVMENNFHDVEDTDVYIDDCVPPPIPGMTIWHYCTPLFDFFTNSRMENDSQKCLSRDVRTIAKNPQDMASAKEYIDEALSIPMHAMKAAIHSTLGSNPGSLTFNRDMFLNIPLIADWHKDEPI